jgi:hypothetical protein
MKLRCYASIYEKSYKITREISQIFEHAHIKLCCYHNESFHGNAYATIIESITKYSLYKTYCPEDLIKINKKLSKFIEKNKLNELKNIYENDEEIIQNIDIRKYFPKAKCEYNFYTFTYEDLINLQKFFKICIDNNLYLQADIE